MYCHSINRPTFSFLMGWGGEFLGEFSVARIIFSTPSFIMNFFLEHFLASDVFFSASNMEKLPLSLSFLSSFYNMRTPRDQAATFPYLGKISSGGED